MKAALPLKETERLEALRRYDILDSEAGQDFDDITLLASHICGTPIALISLVDEDRQWFKSKVGVTIDETPRDIGFCAHGILEPGVFEVRDALADERFATNPLVTGDTKIRFYAGSPLITPEGHALGMLCVQDRVPRELSVGQKSALQALSRQVVALMESRRGLRELRESEERFSGAFEHAPIGVALVSPEGRWLRVNQALCAFVGYSESDLLARTFQDITYPADLEEDLDNVRRLLAGEIRSYQLEKRYIHARGHLVTALLHVSLVRDDAGQPLYFISQIEDVTERKRAELELIAEKARLVAAQAVAKVGSWETDLTTRVVTWSEETYSICGVSPAEFQPTQERVMDLVHPDDRMAVRAAFVRSLDEDGVQTIEHRMLMPDGRVKFVEERWQTSFNKAGRAVRSLGTCQDVSERKQSDLALRSAGEEIQLRALELAKTNQALHVENAERLRTEGALRESEVRYRSLFEGNPLPMWIYDIETLAFLEVNDAAVSHYGYGREEFLSMTIADIIPAAARPAFMAHQANRVDQHTSNARPWKHQKRNGAIIDVEITAHFLDYGTRQAELILASDVTERQRAESERQVISEIARGAIVTTNLKDFLELAHHSIGKVLYAENCFVALKDSATDLLHFEFWVDQVDPIPAPQPVGNGLSGSSYVLRTGQSLLLTEELKTQLYEQGEVHLVGSDSPSWLGVPLRTPAGTIGVLAVQHYETEGVYNQHDLEFLSTVGDQIALAIERKRAEEKVKRSETRLAEAQQVAQVGSWEWDVITNEVIWSDQEYRLLGLAPGQPGASHDFFLSRVHPDFRKGAVEWLDTVLANKKSSQHDIRILRPDGEERTLQSFANVVLDKTGDVVRLVGTSQDVTERKRAEAERQVISEIIQGVITTSNLDELLKLAHRSIGKLLYAENFFVALHDPITDLVYFEFWVDKLDPVPPPQPAGEGHTRTTHILKTGQPLLLTEELKIQLFEQDKVKQSGSDSPSWLGVPLRTPTQTIGVMAVQHYEKEGAYSQRDLEFLSTVGDQIALAIERKRAEETLRESEEKFRQLADNISDAFWIASPDLGTIHYASAGYELIWGRSAESLYANPHQRSNNIVPEDRDHVMAVFGPLRENEPQVSVEYRIARPDGTIRWVHDRGFQVRDTKGSLVRLTGIVTDITERKQIEEELQRQQTELRVLFDLMPAMIWFKDTKNGILRVNQRVAEAAGKSVAEIEGQPSVAIYPDEAAKFYADDLKVIQSGTPKLGLVETLSGPGGEALWVQTDKVPYRDSDGNVIGIVVMAQDITERKRAEAERQVISEIIQGVITTSNLDELLKLAHRSIGKLLYAENFFVALHDPITDLVYFEFWVDKLDPVPPPQPAGEGHTRTTHILKTGQPLLLTEELKIQLFERDKVKHSGSDSPSWLGVPLRTPTQTIGVMAVQHYEKEGAYSQRDLEFLSTVGDQIALAIERKRAEETLRESEEKFQLLADNITDSFWIRSPDMKTVHYISPGYELIWGRTRESLYAEPRNWDAFILPEDRQRVSATFTTLRENEPRVSVEYRIVRPDGAIRWVHARGFQVRDAAGNLIRLTGIVTDITERKKASMLLLESQERLALARDAAHIGIWDWNVVTNELVWDEQMFELYGIMERDFSGAYDAWQKGLHPDDRIRAEAEIMAAVEGASGFHTEFRVLWPDGEVRDIEAHAVVHRALDGSTTRMIGVNWDITERKRAEREQARFAAIMEATTDFVGVADPAGRVLYVNPAGRKMMGFDEQEDVTKTTIPDYSAESDLHRTMNDYVPTAMREGVWSGESIFKSRDGREIPLSQVIIAHKTPGGEVDFMATTGRDLTEHKKAEAELVHAKEAAEAATRTKSEFLANMSHEIRTPMNGILGMTDLVLDTQLDDEQREYLNMAKISGVALLGLINDILDFSKIEAGKLDLESIPFDLREAIAQLLKPLHLRAKKKQLALEAEIASDVPDFLLGDPLRLRQVLLNFADNALKFTERGSVRVKVTLEETGEREHCLHFSVTDTGIGIPTEKQALIFEAFAQADGTTTRTHGGTGLGLTIASHLIDQMRGRIWIESTLGEGTTFHFTARFGVVSARNSGSLPDGPALSAASTGALGIQPSLAPKTEEAGLRILLAEDNVINRALATSMLKKQGHSLVQAANGREAVEAAAREDFDVIFMDVQMPEMDGFDATGLIRKHEATIGRHTPIVAMTAHAMFGDRERCLSAGMDDYLSKPLQRDELFRLLDRVASSGEATLPNEQEDGAEPRPAMLESTPDGLPVYSREELLEQLDDDEELLQRLIGLFQENTPQLVRTIDESIQQQDGSRLACTAHALLSSLGAIGAMDAHRLALRLEELGRVGDYPAASAVFAELTEEVTSIGIVLDQFANQVSVS